MQVDFYMKVKLLAFRKKSGKKPRLLPQHESVESLLQI